MFKEIVDCMQMKMIISILFVDLFFLFFLKRLGEAATTLCFVFANLI